MKTYIVITSYLYFAVITYAYLRIEDEPKKNVRLHCLVITYAYLRIEEVQALPGVKK